MAKITEAKSKFKNRGADPKTSNRTFAQGLLHGLLVFFVLLMVLCLLIYFIFLSRG